MRLFQKTRRFAQMLIDGNFAGLWHQAKIFLKIRGLVPEPILPGADKRQILDKKKISVRTSPEIRIVFFSHDLNFEGASISLFELILALHTKHRVNAQVIAFEDGPLCKQYESAGIPVSIFRCDLSGLSTLKRLDRTVTELAGLIRSRKPDIIFANTLRSFVSILSANSEKIPSVWNIREGAPWNAFFSYLPDAVAQSAISAIRLSSRVVFVSEHSRRIWSKFDLYKNFDVIRNAINLSRFSEAGNDTPQKQARTILGVKDNEIIVLCVGTITKRKGQEDLIDAIQLLPETILKRLRIFFLGNSDSSYAKKLRRKCKSLPLLVKQAIVFWPSTSSVETFYRAANIFVFCSREESFSRVILEAMAFSLPIITSYAGGREQCVDGENALFYQEGDALDLADNIERMVSDDSFSRQMAKNSKKHFDSLETFEQMVHSYYSICQKIS